MNRVLPVLAYVGVFFVAGCITEEVMDPEASVYGRIKADVIYDAAKMNGVSPWYVVSEGDDSLTFEARESRLGVKFTQGDNLTGKAEVDLYGGSTTVKDAAGNKIGTGAVAVNKGTVLLRQMWVKMKLTDQLSVLAGQTGDVFSPLLPAVLNYGWGWNCGNPGYRRPQARIECATGPIVVQVAAARGIGTEASAAADTQARLAYVMKDDMGKPKLTVGISSLQGFADAGRDEQRLASAVDLELKLGKIVLRGEVMPWGNNLSPYLAGIAQDVKTQAGWAQLGVKLTEKLSLNLGYMADDPINDDVPAGGRLRNHGMFLNVRANLTAKAQVGVEFINWNTVYETGENLDNTRMSASMIFTF